MSNCFSTRSARRGWLALAVLASVLSVHAAGAENAVLITNDGDTYEGQLVRQTPDLVILKVGGIDARFDRSDIRQLTIRETPRQIYEQQRAELEDDDLAGRLGLAQRMMDLQALPIARGELVSLDRDFPGTARVTEMLNLVNARLRLQNTAGTAEAPARTSAEREKPNRENPVYLDDSQINLIKVYELDLDTEPRVTIPADTIDQFFERYSDNSAVPTGRRARADFRRMAGHEQLAMLFQVRARELYPDVEVRSEPEPLLQFRRTINSDYVARYFAPLFGQGQIQGLKILSDRPNSDSEAYTNFYLLSTFLYDGMPLINRGDPEQSLLLQWGLERAAARHPAPETEGWQPRFRQTSDEEFQRIVQWIDDLFGGETPDYGIDFSPSES